MHIGRTIPEMIMFALKHCGYKDRLHNRTKLWEVDLAPSENISSLSYTKSMGLSLSPPQLLLPSSLTPPALSSCCSCPQPFQPSQNKQIQAAFVSFIQIHIFTNTKTDKEGEGNTYNPFITQIGVKRFISFGDLMHRSAFFFLQKLFA